MGRVENLAEGLSEGMAGYFGRYPQIFGHGGGYFGDAVHPYGHGSIRYPLDVLTAQGVPLRC